MSKSLIIVESSAKINTIKNFLQNSYDIVASVGHVRDLPKTKLGVNVDSNFEPEYINMRDKSAVIKKLKAAAKTADEIYLASDPDREGEAIAWHIAHILKLKSPKRIRFSEITASAVKESLDNPTEINIGLVDAQQARRVLDRLVGYKLSPLLWRKIKRNLSAGRVQSVAVRLICDREEEIRAFVSEEYWSMAAKLATQTGKENFEATLHTWHGKKPVIKNAEEADAIKLELEGALYKVAQVKESQKRRNPPVPFITSTLQQDASRVLGFSARRTMRIAQSLYEGVELGAQGPVGLITYMRTDSTRIAKEAQDEARKFIDEEFGAQYVPQKARQVVRKGAQDAHEAIRPTSAYRRPEAIKNFLSDDQYKLYRLIWQRLLASQMPPAVFDVVSVNIEAGKGMFRATGSTLRFQGFMKVYRQSKDDDAPVADEDRPSLPKLEKEQLLDLLELLPKQHFTEPPPRFTEASLVKALEENGIGRPSTYASIIGTIQDRKYVELEKKRFVPTELGFIVTQKLVGHFPEIMDISFTAGIEKQLDKIETGELVWTDVVGDFYRPFEKELEEAQEKMERVKIEPKVSDELCPNCGKPMLIRDGRFGEFLGCSGYPECKTTMSMRKKLNIKCPKCVDGDILEKQSKNKRIFYGCSRYPECDYVSWNKPTDKPCPECGYPLGEKKFRNKLVGFKCTNSECSYEADKGGVEKAQEEPKTEK